jgi:putative transposase
MLVSLTRNELARQVRYLKEENEILRAKLPRIVTVTPAERRRLVRLGTAIGPAIRQLIAIVSYRTFRRWVVGQDSRRKPPRRGRPAMQRNIADIVLTLARKNGWGSTRILGELRKLGIRNICRSTVVNILRANGFDPGPKRGQGTWDEFIRTHAATLWACDFVQRRIWTKLGLADFFILFFIHIGTRRVFVSGITDHPHAQWVAQQARNFTIHLHETENEAGYLIHDRDTKFTEQFDRMLQDQGSKIVKTAVSAPNQNAHAERWAQTLQHECLNHFIILGQRHLRYLIGEFVSHYLEERPHQSMGNRPLSRTGNDPPPDKGRILCRQRLGGLLKHYYRKVA